LIGPVDIPLASAARHQVASGTPANWLVDDVMIDPWKPK
jgi:hypothetical protein